ncbi:hypothetical protein BASA81_015609 [Batrachochytrium salamandrivorans]|nr:hypothetical protein BASA81_015609 [Batrachochytrium salamandrivorans]
MASNMVLGGGLVKFRETKKKGDDRFQALLTDAKFRTSSSASKTDSAPKRPIPNNSKPGKAPTAAATGKHKVVVDDRFKSMFEGEEFQSKPVLDRHGRRGAKPTASSSSKDIARHYTLDKVDETRLEKLNQLARGGHNSEDDDSSSGSSSSSSSSGEEDEDEDEQVVFDSDAITKLEMSHDSSHRLACVGCDWDRVRAVDLLAILGSFAPPLGAILRVSIYPTQFGLERMELEDENGPLSATATVLPEEDDEDQGESSNLMGSKYNPELLRKYEKERLLYCVAVIECDSKETAEAVYKECDGLEFEHSSIALDLRFVPNDVKLTLPSCAIRAMKYQTSTKARKSL